MASFEGKACELSDGFSVFGEVDFNAKVFEVYEYGVIEFEGVVVSPSHLFDEFLIDFFTSLCHLLNNFSPIFLKIDRFENTVVNKINGLLLGSHFSSSVSFNYPLRLFFLFLIFLKFLF